MPSEFVKDPDAVLDYEFRWADWLDEANGEIIISGSVIVPSGITLVSGGITNTGTSYTIWVASGTVRNIYLITNRIYTSENRVEDRTMKFTVQPK